MKGRLDIHIAAWDDEVQWDKMNRYLLENKILAKNGFLEDYLKTGSL